MNIIFSLTNLMLMLLFVSDRSSIQTGWQALIGASHSEKFKLFQSGKVAPPHINKELSQDTISATFLENFLRSNVWKVELYDKLYTQLFLQFLAKDVPADSSTFCSEENETRKSICSLVTLKNALFLFSKAAG